MRFIGYVGCMGSGKDTAARYTITQLKNSHHVKIAHPLQDQVALLANIYKSDLSHRQLFEDRKWKEWYPLLTIGDKVYTPRLLLQLLGHGYRTLIGYSIWTDLLDDALLYCPEETTIVVSDIRYEEDYLWFRSKKNNLLVYVDCPIAEQELDPIVKSHVSEGYLKYLEEKADYRLDNNRDQRYFEDIDTLLRYASLQLNR